MRYDGRMDPECVPLCDALSSIPGIVTTESCCGHGNSPFRIWFTVRRPFHNLAVVGRVFDRRYGCPEGWICLLHNSDSPEGVPVFMIDSGSNKGQVAYEQSIVLAKSITEHLQHPLYIKLFGIVTRKG